MRCFFKAWGVYIQLEDDHNYDNNDTGNKQSPAAQEKRYESQTPICSSQTSAKTGGIL